MRRFLTIFLIVTVAVAMWSCSSEEDIAVTGGIYGTITDADTNQPIQGASVTISPTNTSVTTGADGGFVFQNLEGGQYKLTVTKSGYLYNSRQVSVLAGENVIGDMTISTEQAVTGFSLSPETLAFGSTYSELTFTISNTGNTGSNLWSISGVDVDWFSVDPSSGSVGIGEQVSVKVSLVRSLITTDEMSYFIVNAGGGSKSILVTASKAAAGSGDASNTPATDYSDVGVSFTDNDMTGSVTNVSASSTTVAISFSVTNNSGSSKSITFGGTSNMMYQTEAFDNLGGSYDADDGDFSIALGGETSTSYSKSFTLSAGSSRSGTITIYGVSTSATSFDEVQIYFASPVAGSLRLTNVPISR